MRHNDISETEGEGETRKIKFWGQGSPRAEWGIVASKHISSSWTLTVDTGLTIMEIWNREWRIDVKWLQQRRSWNQNLWLGLRGHYDTVRFVSEDATIRNASVTMYYSGDTVLAGDEDGGHLRGRLAIEHGLVTSGFWRGDENTPAIRGPLGISISGSVVLISPSEDTGLTAEIGPQFYFGVNSHSGATHLSFVGGFFFRATTDLK